MVELRDYQRDAIDSVYEWFEESDGNPLIVVPTGGGKSVIAAELIREIVDACPGERIMVVTHVKELIDQNRKALVRFSPHLHLRCGTYSAGLRQRDTRAQVLFCGVQSAFRRPEMFGHFDLVVIDEAHLIPPSGFGMYQKLLTGLTGINPKLKLIGLTATPYRTDTGALDKGDDRMFHGIAYECDIAKLIEDGWLSPIVNRGTKHAVDTSSVGTRAGDFKKDELERAAMRDGLVDHAVAELMDRAEGRKHWLVFCCGIAHAEQVASAIEKYGVTTAKVFGNTPGPRRDAIIESYRRGDIQCMVNVGVLTTGFDAPHIDLIALMRPTQSPGLYVQMVGRGLRIADGKDDCLVLDFGGNIVRHGPLNNVRPAKQGKGDGETDPDDAPAKECPECQLIVHAAVTVCPGCGYEFPKREFDHDKTPDEQSSIIADKTAIQKWPVASVHYERWSPRHPGKPPTMRVTYGSGLTRQASEWVCFEHDGYARQKAIAWWHKAGGLDPVPDDIASAVARARLELLSPETITVDTRPEWPEIKGIVWSRGSDDTFAEKDAEEGVEHAPTWDDDIPF